MASDDKLYIQMFSIHGLIRNRQLEMGRDADTGGQITYVLELARSLSQLPEVERVDVVTRLIVDKSVSEDYAVPIEVVNDKFRIVRIQCGGRKYMRKELLWPHLDEFTDKTVKFIRRDGRIPDIIHGHYADAGYVAMELSQVFGTPFIFTGHSMGRVKREKLRNDGMKPAEIQRRYRIDQRINAEEAVINNADLIITSTHQEIKEQYGLYPNGQEVNYHVIPPGLNVQRFYPFYHDMISSMEKPEAATYARASLHKELNRFFRQPDKPLILALSRPDKRKNISGLVEAFGADLELRAMANLAIFAGLRKDIESMEENERDVLTRMLLLMDKFDLYGKMAIPKKHDFDLEVPELYRIAAHLGGVFVNPALTEPFGLTLLEASASGLPFVATNDGGPQDIVANCHNGVLVDPSDPKAIAGALKKILADKECWERYSRNGVMNVRNMYTWQSHAASYISALQKPLVSSGADMIGPIKIKDAIGRRLASLNAFLITDIDDTLIGGDDAPLRQLLDWLEQHRDKIGFGVATGRHVQSAVAYLKKHGIATPDVVISSVGTEIDYGEHLHHSRSWAAHIANKWDREKIRETIDGLSFLTYQEKDNQRPFKISYYMKPGKDRLPLIHDTLIRNKCKYHLVYSQNRNLDILPYRASKGKAIRFVSYKWEIPLRNMLVCGDSGNDAEMLRGEPLGVVVGNYSPEIESLKGARNVFFAKADHAAGILEGLKRYRFFERIQKGQRP